MGEGKKSKLSKADRQAMRDVEHLRATVDKLEAKIEKLQAKTKRWKAKARDERAKRAKLEARLRRLGQERPADHSSGDTGDVPVEPPAPASSTPDGSWTVARLRSHARDEGLTGYSRLSKAELLDRLAARS